MKNEKGFTLIELIVVVVIIGILAAIAIPRFMGAQDRARIGACCADVDQFRQALGLYEIDYADFPAGPYATAAALEAVLLMPAAAGGGPYMSLPQGENWTAFSYVRVAGPPSSYTITATAKDNAGTTVTGTPEKTSY